MPKNRYIIEDYEYNGVDSFATSVYDNVLDRYLTDSELEEHNDTLYDQLADSLINEGYVFD